MKVAYFLGGLNRGGAETLILDICRQHAKVPYDFVCVYRHEGNMSEAFRESGAPMVQIAKTLGYLRYLWSIRRTLLREHVTIVHSQTPSNTLLLAIALLGTGIQIITTFHGHMFAEAPWWKRKIVYAASETILCVSEYQKRYYEQKWGLPKENKLRVVYNGIDFSKFDSEKSIVESEELKVKSGLRLCMVGNFIKGRSQIVVCEALKELSVKCKVEGVKWDFYFIGRRDETEPWRYDRCECYCKEHHLHNVHFLGAREDVPTLLKSMDGVVYSTEHDTFGIAVIEAIAAGLPVALNDWVVMKEVCDLGLSKKNRAIRFFKTENIEDCAEKICDLLKEISSTQLHADCQQAGKKVKEKYSIEKHIERLNEIYSSMNE